MIAVLAHTAFGSRHEAPAEEIWLPFGSVQVIAPIQALTFMYYTHTGNLLKQKTRLQEEKSVVAWHEAQ